MNAVNSLDNFIRMYLEHIKERTRENPSGDYILSSPEERVYYNSQLDNNNLISLCELNNDT